MVLFHYFFLLVVIVEVPLGQTWQILTKYKKILRGRGGYLDLRSALAYSILAGLGAPHEIERGAEALVTPREARVDDVLAVAAHHHETPIVVVLQFLGVDLAVSELFCGKGEALAVGDLRGAVGGRLDARSLDLVVACPDDLALAIIVLEREGSSRIRIC
jgi:hypothetical protein